MSVLTHVFDIDLREIEDEWREIDMELKYGSVLNDILVQHWDEFANPIVEFKSEKVYGIFRDLVHSKTISGTFYREVEDHEHFEHLQAGDQIDYRSCLTTWLPGIPEDTDILKITCQNVAGLEIYALGKVVKVVLCECKLNVLYRNDFIIEVSL
jgi:hypothetical protein